MGSGENGSKVEIRYGGHDREGILENFADDVFGAFCAGP